MRLLAFLLIILAQPLMGKNPWQLIKNEKGIKVYKKADPKSKLLVFKGTGVINKELVYVLAVLADVKSLHKWIETVKRVEILEKRSNTELITYTITKAPWPLKDRDSVALGRVTFDKKNKWVHIRSRETKHRKKPVVERYVRVPYLRARWSFTPVKNGKATWAEFTVQADPGGIIPSWVVNWVSKNVPYNSIENLRKRLQQGKFNPNFVEQNKKYMKDW